MFIALMLFVLHLMLLSWKESICSKLLVFENKRVKRLELEIKEFQEDKKLTISKWSRVF